IASGQNLSGSTRWKVDGRSSDTRLIRQPPFMQQATSLSRCPTLLTPANKHRSAPSLSELESGKKIRKGVIEVVNLDRVCSRSDQLQVLSICRMTPKFTRSGRQRKLCVTVFAPAGRCRLIDQRAFIDLA